MEQFDRVVDVPFLDVSKVRLDGALNNLTMAFLPKAGELELGHVKGPFQDKPHYDSMK